MRTKNLSVTRPSNSIIYQKVISVLKKYKKNNRFVVGISGGPDSLALASITNLINKEKNYKFYFATVDHGIRKNSGNEAQKVKKILKSRKINITILKNKIKIANNIQKKAREVRYNLLANFCKKKNAKSLVVAHHQDDQVETFLIRLSRGSGVEGLSSMKEMTSLNNGIRLIRPLLDFRKIELTRIAKKEFGKIIIDPSNKNKKFLRTNIRDLKKDLVNKGINIERITRSIKNLALTKEAIDFYVAKSIKKFVSFQKKTTVLNLVKFKKEPQEIRFRIINNIVKKRSNSYYPPRSKKIFTALKYLNSSKEIKHQLGGCLLISRNKYIYIEKTL